MASTKSSNVKVTSIAQNAQSSLAKWKHFLNPMAKHDVRDFPGVLIPLASARRKSSIPSDERHLWGLEATVTTTTTSQQAGILTIDSLRAEIDSELATAAYDTSYDRKSMVINKAIQDMGMGLYQWKLFCLCGFGWFADNLWLQSVAVTLPSLANEFHLTESHVRYTTMCLFIGLCIGASFWGIASDIIGRRPAFNTTLFLAGVFGMAAGGAPSWIAVCSLYSCIGLGIGGNLPVDGALFVEFLPFANGNLLTLLSIWWPIGELVSSLAAWPLIVNFSCKNPATCTREDNMGWRYFVLTMGGLTFVMFICRFFLFRLFESPKFLLSRGRQAEAVAVVHGIAYHNKQKTWLTEEILNEIGGHPDQCTDLQLSNYEIVRRSLSTFSADRIGPLFAYRQLAITTTLIWLIWIAIGMGYPLFNAFLVQFLSGEHVAADVAYRNYAVTAIVGVPGSVAAFWLVDVPYIGRKGTMAVSTVVTGILLFCFTISADPNFQLTFSSIEAPFQNIAYGVLFAYTPEIFPAPVRGTGTGIAAFLNRVAGLCAPILAVNVNANPKSPIYAAAVLFLIAFVAMVVLPIETRGRQRL